MGDRGVTDRSAVSKGIAHPTVGPLVFGIAAVRVLHDPDQRLVVYTVDPYGPGAGPRRCTPTRATASAAVGEPGSARYQGARRGIVDKSKLGRVRWVVERPIPWLLRSKRLGLRSTAPTAQRSRCSPSPAP